MEGGDGKRTGDQGRMTARYPWDIQGKLVGRYEREDGHDSSTFLNQIMCTRAYLEIARLPGLTIHFLHRAQ